MTREDGAHALTEQVSPMLCQVGKGAIVDVNTTVEKDLVTLPHMTPAIVKGVLEKRPFAEFNEYRPWKNLGAVRQGDQQVRRPGRNRPPYTVRVHSR